MAEPLDPYRDWLDISGGRRAVNYYRLLGLEPFEPDRLRIQAGAAAASDRVRQRAKPHENALRDKVLAQVRAAEQCLLDPQQRQRYDAQLRVRQRQNSGGDSAQASPAQPDIPVARPLEAAEVLAIGAVPPSAASSSLPESLWEDDGALPVARSSVRVRTRSRGPWPLVVVALLAVAAAGLGGVAMWQMNTPQPVAVLRGPVEPVAPPPAIPSEPETDMVDAPPTTPPTTTVDDPFQGHAGVSRPEDAAPASVPHADDGVPFTPTVAEPIPEPPTSVAASPASRHNVRRALNRARVALAARQIDAARQHLAEAAQLSPDAKQRESIERLDALAEQLERFLQVVRAGWMKFSVAEELPTGGEFVAVVEVGPEKVVLRSAGSQHEYTAATLPAPIALTFARAGIDEKSPPAKVMFGALFAADPRGNRAQARQLWQSAAADGESVEKLLALAAADDLALEREPVPAADARAAAEKSVTQEFAVTLRGARSPEQKAYLVEQLLEAAAASDDAARQYALLCEAGARAAIAGDAPRALAAIDELGRWFEVDTLALKTQALSKTRTAGQTPEESAQVAEAALSLLDQVNDRPELARTLAATAAGAARRSDNQDLIQKATRRRREVERAAK